MNCGLLRLHMVRAPPPWLLPALRLAIVVAVVGALGGLATEDCMNFGTLAAEVRSAAVSIDSPFFAPPSTFAPELTPALIPESAVKVNGSLALI